MQQPKVSVIIPVYNTEKYLRKCLDSVLGQTLREIEVLCIDDGSQDNSLSILYQYASLDKRIKVFTQKNQFAGSARNLGMSHGSGEYYAFLDSDDFFEQDGIEKLYLRAQKENLDFIKAQACIVDEKTGKICMDDYFSFTAFGKKFLNQTFSFKDLPARALSIADVPWNGLYKAAFLKKNNIFFNHLRCANDRSFFIHCLLAAQRFMVTDDLLTYYRVNRGDSLVSVRNQHFECQLESYRIIKQIVLTVRPEVKQVVLQRELDNLFHWRKRILATGSSITNEEPLLKQFVREYDISDVGEAYLHRAPYYCDFLYFTEDKSEKKSVRASNFYHFNVLRRGIYLCREFGLGYVLHRIINHRGRKK